MTIMAIDPRSLRNAFGAFPTGVTVVTTCNDKGDPIGFTANSFTSVSLDPPLLLVCLAKTSRNYAIMTAANFFAVNVLSETQKDVSNTFARPVENRFAAVEWSRGSSGCPILSNVSAWFECGLEQVVEAGDHVILVGRIQSFDDSGKNGLGYVRGGYYTPILESKAVSAAVGGNIELSAVVERRGEVLLIGNESLSLPACEADDGSPTQKLQTYLEALTGLTVTIGFLYSVFEEKQESKQHIVYRATALSGEPRTGRFLKPEALVPSVFDNKATADIVARFAVESSVGNFGLYFGDETAGTVRPIPARVSKQ